MNVRTVAVMLALLVASAPVAALVCELDCDASKTGAPACHKPGAAGASGSVRDASVDCHQRHDPPEVTVTNAKPIDPGAASIVATGASPVALVVAADNRQAATHDPPGLNAHITTPRSTVLRI